jgi:hypothetical protein
MILAAMALAILQSNDVADLDSPDPLVARRAMEAIVRKGDEKPLQAVEKTSAGAKRALAEMRAHQRFGEAYPPSMAITFEAKDRPVAEVVDALSKLVKKRITYEVRDPADEKRTVTLSLKDATFLETLDALTLAIPAWDSIEEDVIKLQPALAIFPRDPVSYWRHGKVTVSTFTEVRGLLDGGKNVARLYFTHWIDGGCRAVGYGAPRLTEVTDDTGASLAPEAYAPYAGYGPYHGYQQFGVHLSIKPPAAAATKLVTLRGTQRFYFPESPTFAEIPWGGKGSIQAENVVIRLEEATASGASVKVVAEFADWRKPHVRPLPSDFQLMGKDGRGIQATGSSAGPVESITLRLTFDLPAKFEAASLKVRTFKSIGDHEFPFEFKDLPLR